MKELKRGDTVYLCTKRAVINTKVVLRFEVYDTPAEVRSVEDGIVTVSFEQNFHEDLMTLPMYKIRTEPIPSACSGCAHRLRLLTSGSCPVSYRPIDFE